MCFVTWYQGHRRRGVLDDNCSYFLSIPYVLAPHLDCLSGMVQMRGHNMFFSLFFFLQKKGKEKQDFFLIVAGYSRLSGAMMVWFVTEADWEMGNLSSLGTYRNFFVLRMVIRIILVNDSLNVFFFPVKFPL